MSRAVADREDVRQARSAVAVDRHAVAALGARRDQRLDGRDDPDTDDHHLSLQHLAVGQPHAGDAILAQDAVDADAQPHIDAMGAMFGLDEARQILAGHPGQHPVERLDQGDLLAELGEHRRGLEADIAAADHHRLRDLRQLGHHPVGVGAGAHGVHALQMMGPGQFARRAARRPDHVTIADHLSGLGRDSVSGGVDGGHRRAELEADVTFGPEGFRTDQQAFKRFVAGQVFLGQWRPFVGQVRLGADDQDLAFELALAQRDRARRPGVAGADNQDIRIVTHSTVPWSSSVAPAPKVAAA